MDARKLLPKPRQFSVDAEEPPIERWQFGLKSVFLLTTACAVLAATGVPIPLVLFATLGFVAVGYSAHCARLRR
jgi:hypothetical protein